MTISFYSINKGTQAKQVIEDSVSTLRSVPLKQSSHKLVKLPKKEYWLIGKYDNFSNESSLQQKPAVASRDSVEKNKNDGSKLEGQKGQVCFKSLLLYFYVKNSFIHYSLQQKNKNDGSKSEGQEGQVCFKSLLLYYLR